MSPTQISVFCDVLLCFFLAIIIAIIFLATTVSGGNPVLDLVPPPKSHQRFPSKPLFLSLHDDDSLLRVASRVDSQLPPGSPKKVAFLFLTISLFPSALIRELFFNRTPRNFFNVYVHVDPSQKKKKTNCGIWSSD
ncbi:hypothetical protein like AT5G25330 [Hibiscus trionum]|uniref:Uncharacterized protein n=1 Tax=Hibiscus trionum TaxID=183268 RepID=A0A9W7HVB3_HIBTR|nr:hypothetical protein like AT5G25330 [Hibiscus trionum]